MTATKLDVLAVGAHPDDVELSCGATVALLARRGRRVGILHLTRGEAGDRGATQERQQEAREAGAMLGASEVTFLDCRDGGLRHGDAEEDALVELLRRWQPELVLGPPPAERHPDHRRAHQLVEDACFYAGLSRRGTGLQHRPAAFFCYIQYDALAPSFVVDVTTSWETKMRALGAYSSQLHVGVANASRDEPATWISSREFWLAIEGRARHYGALVGVEFGEAFWSRRPIGVQDPLSLVIRSSR